MHFKQHGADRNHENREIDKELHRSAHVIASVSQRGNRQAGSGMKIAQVGGTITFAYFAHNLRGPLLG
jgi:hypothetical protein